MSNTEKKIIRTVVTFSDEISIKAYENFKQASKIVGSDAGLIRMLIIEKYNNINIELPKINIKVQNKIKENIIDEDNEFLKSIENTTNIFKNI